MHEFLNGDFEIYDECEYSSRHMNIDSILEERYYIINTSVLLHKIYIAEIVHRNTFLSYLMRFMFSLLMHASNIFSYFEKTRIRQLIIDNILELLIDATS